MPPWVDVVLINDVLLPCSGCARNWVAHETATNYAKWLSLVLTGCPHLTIDVFFSSVMAAFSSCSDFLR